MHFFRVRKTIEYVVEVQVPSAEDSENHAARAAEEHAWGEARGTFSHDATFEVSREKTVEARPMERLTVEQLERLYGTE